MSASKLSGDWNVKLEPHIIQEVRGGLLYDHDTWQDRVIVTQNGVSRQVGWWPREIGVVLPLSGMIHPDDIAEIQKLIQIQRGLDPHEFKPPAEIIDPGRNAAEQAADFEEDESEE